MNLRQLLSVITLTVVTHIVYAQPHPSPIWSVFTQGHSIREADLSRDGQFIATAGMSHTVQIRRVSDGSLVKSFSAHEGSVVAVQFSSDGSILASVGRDEKLKLWSLPDPTPLDSLTNIVFGGSANNSAVAFSPDDSKFVSPLKNSSTNIGLWSLNKELHASQLLYALSNRVEMHAAEFSPDGAIVATAGGIRGQDTTVKIWNPLTGALLKTLQTSNTYGVDDLAFSPDGKILATGTSPYPHFSGNIELWNTSDWSLLHRLPGQGYSLEFSRDGQSLISLRTGNLIDLWQVTSGNLLRTYHAPPLEYGSISTLNITPDGRTLLLGSQVNRDGVAHGQLTAVLYPGDLLEAQLSGGRLQLNWLQPAATFQHRTNFESPWVDLPADQFENLLEPSNIPTRFFRLKPKAE